MDMSKLPKSLELTEEGGRLALRFVDERLLPGELCIRETSDWLEVIEAIKTLAVRGAPAIGLAGASALALWAAGAVGEMPPERRAAPHGEASGGAPALDFFAQIDNAASRIVAARPTAVNLEWAVARALEHAQALPPARVPRALFELVVAMQEEDEAANRAIGRNGAALIGRGSRILTHCNAGSLATYFYGTALGVVYAAAEQGKVERVYADETRPLGQGARLTAWELARVGIPTTLICDSMAASLMAQGQVDVVVVGADRIARNGDAANKIGTLGVAILAREHGIPFYVAAPRSTIDASLADGSGITIEQRCAEEVLPVPIEGVDVWNPAFDVTPARYITGIVTEDGVFSPNELESQL